jgi:hypothetical protein
MIKKFNKFITKDKGITYGSSPSVRYYNSHGSWTTFSDLKDIEANERGNYPIEDFNLWQSKYAIADDDLALWVSPNKLVVYRYLFTAEYWDDIADMNQSQIKRLARKEDIDIDLYEVTDKEGFIIPESDDGEEGYIFIRNKVNFVKR